MKGESKEMRGIIDLYKVYKTSQFSYNLPKNLIAQEPPQNREDARLMVVNRQTEKITIGKFPDIVNYLEEGDLVILNDTRVFPAKLVGYKMSTGARVEILLLRELVPENHIWDVIAYPPRKVRVGNKLILGKSQGSQFLVATVISNTENKGKIIKFNFEGTSEELKDLIRKIGEIPLPPYIKREPNEKDYEMYQTVYAKKEGSIAAPTAGLHFSEIILKKLKLKGVNIATITLHIGLGSFRLINTEDVSKFRMDTEYFEIPEETARIFNETKKKNKRILAVGTSVLRALESAPSSSKGEIRPYAGWTSLYIHYPYEFTTANALLTNFHMPKSPPLVMTWTFGGIELMKRAYEIAVQEKFRFLSYGDAMLII